jgi:phage terminase large subunit-like protein
LDGAVARGEVEREGGLTIARHFDAGTLVYNYEAPTTDPHDVAALKLANPAPWITEEFLRRQAENDELTDADVLQLHGGVWAAGVDSWLPGGLWRSCEVERGAPADGAEIVLAFDGSYKRDSTALVGCTLEETPHIFVVDVWERPEDARRDWRVPREEVKARVDEAMQRWRVVEFACDPPGWHAEIEEWGERYAGTQTLMFNSNQRVRMTEACSQFYSALVEKRLSHDGNHRLAVHLANAVVKVGPNVKYISKEHPESTRKIDLAVAAVMAHSVALDQKTAFSGPLFEVLA